MEGSSRTGPLPGWRAYIPRIGLLLALGTVLFTAGCLGSSGTGSDEDDDYLEATYQAEGPLYLPGFWPAWEQQHLGGPGHQTELTVRLSPGEPELDASGTLVDTVNLTYHFWGNEWITQWVHPATGKIVATEQTRHGTGNSTTWHWTTSGLPAFTDRFDQLATGQPPKGPITVTCCPDHKAYQPSPNASLTLTLENVDGHTDWLDTETENARDWTPPRPSHPTQRAPWTGHHPPEASDHDHPFPLTEALEALRSCSPDADAYLDEHPNWRLVYSSLWDLPGQVHGVSHVYTWSLQFNAGEEQVSIWSVKKRVQQLENDTLIHTYACGAQSGHEDRLWQQQPPGPMLTYHDGWALLSSMLPSSKDGTTHLVHYPRKGGPLVTAELRLNSPELGTTDIGLDLETGLLSHYKGPDPPKDLVENPADAWQPASSPDTLGPAVQYTASPRSTIHRGPGHG